jgi:ABC-2 type transport system ATP-binding protein
MSENAVEVRALSKSFPNVKAINGLDLVIERGEMFCLVGPDGAGKTTLIRIFCGILPFDTGQVKILDREVPQDMAEIKSKIGYLSQKFSLYGDLTIDENIEFFADLHDVKDFSSRREELLEFTRLKPFRRRLAERLSGGMKQKLALACTLIHTPQIVFLDEPTTGVDPVSRRDFWKILSDLLKKHITIVMTTPYLDEAERAHRVALMNEGRLMALDTPQKVKSLLPGEVIEIVCQPVRKAFNLISEHKDVRDTQAFGDRLNVVLVNNIKNPILIVEWLKSRGIEIESWRKIPPSLENVFISLLRK